MCFCTHFVPPPTPDPHEGAVPPAELHLRDGEHGQPQLLLLPPHCEGGLGRRPSAPAAFPYLNYDPSLWYHSSSVLALALDALTLPYRLHRDSVPMWQMADSLAVSGRKVVAAYGAVPLPMMQGSSLPDALTACTEALPWKPLSAALNLTTGDYMASGRRSKATRDRG
ncbi:hypothetical protein F7725_025519 [Dissostichus mawsoni]|uniref:Uncharacterized protein n=1 Tax=Dissostichus mawsoni TaxID=36200 RepID=A0A7J5XBF9_DISMA|nr:hypothetical protein F7725_025519 [Dissostichus mawsoni]